MELMHDGVSFRHFLVAQPYDFAGSVCQNTREGGVVVPPIIAVPPVDAHAIGSRAHGDDDIVDAAPSGISVPAGGDEVAAPIDVPVGPVVRVGRRAARIAVTPHKAERSRAARDSEACALRGLDVARPVLGPEEQFVGNYSAHCRYGNSRTRLDRAAVKAVVGGLSHPDCSCPLR